MSGHQQKVLIEVSVVSKALWQPDPEYRTMHIPNQRSLLSGIHTTFPSLTKIFPSPSEFQIELAGDRQVLGVADLNEGWPFFGYRHST